MKIPLYYEKTRHFNGFDDSVWKTYGPDEWSLQDPIGIDNENVEVINEKNTKNFFYPIFLSHWLYPIKDSNRKLWNNFSLPPYVEKMLKQKKCKILIHNTMEGWPLSSLDEVIDCAILQKYNLDKSCIVYVTGNLMPNSPSGIPNIYKNLFEQIYNFYTRKQFDFKNYGVNFNKKNSYLPNKFLCLNRRPSAQRLALYEFIYNYKEHGIITQATDVNNNNNIFHALEEFKIYFPKLHKRFHKRNLLDTLPAVYDYNDMVYTNPTHDIKLRKYYDSYLHIVSETFYNDQPDRMFFSEKIIKPMFFMRPFVLFGEAHSLEYLKKLGYKTFSNWIDESYDTIEDYNKRFQITCNSINKFINRDKKYIHADLIEMNSILEHNYFTLKNRSNNNKKFFKKLIKTLNKNLD